MIELAKRPGPASTPFDAAEALRGALAMSWRLAIGSSRGLVVRAPAPGPRRRLGLQFTLLKIAVDARLGEFGILAGSMVLLAAL